MAEELDYGNPQEGESIAELGEIEVSGRRLFISRWKWHGTRGEQIIFSETKGFVPRGTWRCASVKYRTLENDEVVFSGISIPPDLHGNGTTFFEYFLNDCLVRNKKVVGTDVIRKPLMAQMLKRAGWVPESVTHMAEILPLSKYTATSIPKVYAVDGNVPTSDKWKDFYDIVEPNVVERVYPLTNPEHSHVAIFTRYFPRESNLTSKIDSV